MAILVWDQAGERTYETGVEKGVLYPAGIGEQSGTYPEGFAWNGLTGVTETPSGAEETKLYANNKKYISLRSAEDLGGTIEAYTYPDEWGACDGSASIVRGVKVSQQSRRAFGMSYKTLIGNDTEGDDHGYNLHLIYGATVSPSERAFATVNDSPEAITFSWEFSTTPVDIPSSIGDFKPTSLITINTTELEGGKNNAQLKELEDILYGTAETNARLPLPSEVYRLFNVTPGPTYTYTKVADDAVFDATETYYVKNGDEYEVDSDVTELNFEEKKSTLYIRTEQAAG